MIQPYNKGKNKSVIVWACFRDNSQKSDLTYMPGNPDSTTAEGSYISSILRSFGGTASKTMGTRPDFYAR